MKSLVAGALSLLVCASSAQAAAIMSFQEVGGNVVGTLSGSLNLNGMTFSSGWSSGSNYVDPVEGLFGTGAPGSNQDGYLDQVAGGVWGTGGATSASSTTGDAVFLWGGGGDLWLPGGYVSGGALSGTLSFAGASLASLGATLGDHVYTLSSGDTLTVRVGAAVPEPGSLALAVTSLSLLGLSVRRRRR